MISREAALQLRSMIESRRDNNLSDIKEAQARLDNFRNSVHLAEITLEALIAKESSYIELMDLCAQSLGEMVN